MKPVGVAVVGAGYWGPNLFRNFLASEAVDLRWVCDLDRARARKLVGRYSTVGVTDSLYDVLDDGGVEAVALATPARTHGELGLACLDAGKHLMVEKPLASSVAEGEKLVAVLPSHAHEESGAEQTGEELAVLEGAGVEHPHPDPPPQAGEGVAGETNYSAR